MALSPIYEAGSCAPNKGKNPHPVPILSKISPDPQVWIRFPALPDFLTSSGSGTGSTQPREYN
jgi:hypothetical protein